MGLTLATGVFVGSASAAIAVWISGTSCVYATKVMPGVSGADREASFVGLALLVQDTANPEIRLRIARQYIRW